MNSALYLLFLISVALLVIASTSALEQEKTGNLRVQPLEESQRKLEQYATYDDYDDDYEILGNSQDDDESEIADYYEEDYGEFVLNFLTCACAWLSEKRISYPSPEFQTCVQIGSYYDDDGK
jgi:hypothetical protein